MPDRADQRLAWVRQALSAPEATLEPASADASFRSYWRVRVGTASWVLMDAPPQHEDVRPWLDVAQRLAAAGVEAPAVLASDAALGFVLMSDLGDATLLPALRAHCHDDSRDGTVETLYSRALALLLRMQRHVDGNGLPHYDEQRLVAEMELMPEWFLGRHLGFTPDCDQWDIVEMAFRALVNSALEQPTVFVHRDFHSRNLMLQADGTLATIDFQDAVLGPVTYDLVSLLRDCYIAWPDARVAAWVDEYWRELADAGVVAVDAARFRRWFDLMGLQRHIKVLGIFCRLWYRDGKAGYLGDLDLVWRYTREVGRRYADVAPLVDLIDAAIDGRDLGRPAGER